MTRVLQFSDLSARHGGVSAGVSNSYAEAVRVCLDRHHISPVEFKLQDTNREESAIAEWARADDRTKGAWANKDDATEAGAYGLALAAVEELRGLIAVRRAETKTGADYYLGQPGTTFEDLEASVRLEVSGTDEGGTSVISGRLRQKLEQAKRGKSNLPAIASVVGFSALHIASADVEET